MNGWTGSRYRGVSFQRLERNKNITRETVKPAKIVLLSASYRQQNPNLFMKKARLIPLT